MVRIIQFLLGGGLIALYRAIRGRSKNELPSGDLVPTATFLITSPGGVQREVRLRMSADLDDVPLDVALGLTDGDHVQLKPVDRRKTCSSE